MSVHNPIKEWIDAKSTGTPGGYALRGLVLGLTLVLVASVWFLLGQRAHEGWPAMVMVAMGLGGLMSAFNPDGPGPMLVMVLTTAAWWFGGWGAPFWQGGIVGLALLAFHMGCAWAALGPLHSASSRRMLRRLAVRGAAVLGASVVAIGVVGLGLVLPVAASSPVWLVLAGVVVLVGVGALLVARRDPPPPAG